MTFFHSTEDINAQELLPGFFAYMVHTDTMTIAHFHIKAGSILPEHHHIHEQVSNVISGSFEMTVDGLTQLGSAGTIITIPPNTPHSGRALTDCYIVDIFRPVREDYK